MWPAVQLLVNHSIWFLFCVICSFVFLHFAVLFIYVVTWNCLLIFLCFPFFFGLCLSLRSRWPQSKGFQVWVKEDCKNFKKSSPVCVHQVSVFCENVSLCCYWCSIKHILKKRRQCICACVLSTRAIRFCKCSSRGVQCSNFFFHFFWSTTFNLYSNPWDCCCQAVLTCTAWC